MNCSDKTCNNCIQGERHVIKGTNVIVCENYVYCIGMPVDRTPPNNDACSNWSSNLKEKDKPQTELRDYIDYISMNNDY